MIWRRVACAVLGHQFDSLRIWDERTGALFNVCLRCGKRRSPCAP